MHLASLLANLHFVAPDLARCAQPFTLGQVRAILKRHSFRTLVNLRGENPNAYWYRDERRACAETGCDHVDLMLSSKRLPSRTDLLRLRDLFDYAVKPMLIKCSGGADRTGLASGLYLLLTQPNATLADAHAQLRLFPYWHKPKPQQRWIKEFWAYFEATRGDRTLRVWLETVYSANSFAAHLIAQGKGDYWRR